MSKIEWCDLTLNPIVGCSKCSPGCENCYAEKFAARLAKNPATAKKYAGVVDEQGKWTGEIKALLDDRDMPHRAPGKNKRVFIGSMSDLFHPRVSDATRDAIFASILCDHIVTNSHGHTFMMLTKRAEEMHNYFSVEKEDLLRRWWKAGSGWLHIDEGDEWFSEYAEEICRWKSLWPLPNLWLGVTVCNQEEAEEKLPILMQIPAAKRFVSVEPMLEEVTIPLIMNSLPAWVICGAETGPRARPMNLQWARNLRDQCQAERIPFFFKKAGNKKPIPDDLMVREFPEGK